VVAARSRSFFDWSLWSAGVLATITVTGTGDTIANDGVITLREAITAANTNAASGDAPAGDAGLDTIAFNIRRGPHTITPTSPLPNIIDAVTINGVTNPALPVRPVVVLNGGQCGGQRERPDPHGGRQHGAGLVIQGFQGNGILITGRQNATGNVVQGNFMRHRRDRDAGGRHGNDGVLIQNAANNTVGGLTAAARNLISGNGVSVSRFQTPARQPRGPG